MEAFRAVIKGWLGKTLLGIIVVIFGAFGLQALSSIVIRPKPAIEVNGDEVSQQALDKIIAIQKQSMLARMGNQADPKLLDSPEFRKRIIDGLIERTLLKQAGDQQGLSVAEEGIKQNIMSMPQFQKDGKFSEENFNAMVRQYGFSPTQFLQEVASDYQINQLREGLMTSSFMTSPELKQVFELEKQTRGLIYAVLPVNAYQASVQISPTQISTYYQQHQKDFLTQPQAQFDFIQLSSADYAKQVKITEDEIKAEYEKQKQAALNPAQEQRRGAHILLEVDPKHPEAATQQLLAIKKQIQQGADFTKLAKQYSKDPGSADQGGDLGFAGHGVFDPKFEAALFALKQPGDLSDIVKTPYGVHLIQLKEIKKPSFATFEVLKASITDQLAQQKSAKLYQDAVNELQEKAFEAGDLKALTKNFLSPIQHSGWIVQQSNNLKDPLFNNKKVLDAAFSSAVLTEGRNSDVIEIDPQHSVVLRKAQYRPAVVKPLAAVSEAIKTLLSEQQAMTKAQAAAKDIVAQLQKGIPREKITAQYNVTWVTHTDIKRNDFKDLDPRWVKKLFSLPKPSKAGEVVYDSLTTEKSAVILGLVSVATDMTLPKPQELQQAQSFLESQLGQRDFSYFLQYAKSNAKIKIHE